MISLPIHWIIYALSLDVSRLREFALCGVIPRKGEKQDMCDCVRCLMSYSVNIAPISQYWSQPETEWQLGYLFSNVSEENMEHKIGYKVILWVDTTLIFESLLTTFDRKSIVKYLLFVTRVRRSKLLVPTEENH